MGSDDRNAPVTMLVNSSELRAADFPLAEVRSLQLDVVALGDRRTRGVTVRKLHQDVGNTDTLGLVKSYFSSFLRKKNVLVLRRPRSSCDLPVCRITS